MRIDKFEYDCSWSGTGKTFDVHPKLIRRSIFLKFWKWHIRINIDRMESK